MKRWQFWVGLVLSAGFLYLALRGLGISDIWQPLKSARYWWLLPGVGVYFIGVWVRSWRWHFLLRPVKKIKTSLTFPIVAMGYMGNNIYPARAGEVLRAFVLKRREDIPISASLATIIVERIFDGVVMLGFGILKSTRISNIDRRIRVYWQYSIFGDLGLSGFFWCPGSVSYSGDVSDPGRENNIKADRSVPARTIP